MRTRFHGESDVGLHRKHNEDSFLADPELGLFVVADGVGGRAKGEIASREAVEHIWDWVKREEPQLVDARDSYSSAAVAAVCRVMRGAIQNACYMVHGLGEIDPEHRGMSTTVSCLLLCGSVAVVGQVGDSRIYLARGGEISQLTEDHTLVNHQLRHGLITPEEAAASRAKNVITRAVGHKEWVEVDVMPVPLFPGDRFLLCSDGLHGYIGNADELRYLLEMDVQAAAREAIRFANARGGKDNITSIVVELV